MNLIYVSFIFSSILVIGISIHLWNFELEMQTEFSKVKIFIVVVFVLISLVLSNYIYRKNLDRIDQNDQLILKLQAFQTASIYRLSILEFTIIITIVLFTFTKVWFLLFLVFILLIFLIFSRPSKKKFLNLFHLSEEDIKSIS